MDKSKFGQESVMGLLNEFKQFAVRGNVVDLAVAVIIGGAFGKIISALVDGVIMPLIGLLLGGINIAGQSFTLGHAVVRWGMFLQTVIDFTIISLCIFIAIRFLLQRRMDAPPKKSPEEVLLTEIRDILKQNQQQPSVDNATK